MIFRSSLFATTLGLSLSLLPVCAPAASLPRTMQSSSETEKELRKFLLSTKGSYGWKPAKGTISYDFLADGRLAVQGSDGEATMWEGKWRLSGNTLTMTYNGSTKTVSAEIDDEDLLLDGKRYSRYRP